VLSVSLLTKKQKEKKGKKRNKKKKRVTERDQEEATADLGQKREISPICKC